MKKIGGLNSTGTGLDVDINIFIQRTDKKFASDQNDSFLLDLTRGILYFAFNFFIRDSY
jgi:hypothetical protein